MHIFFVGDGERDAVTVPTLVSRILGRNFGEECRNWARLHGAGRGYKKKLLFAMIQAREVRADALVATVDRDRDKTDAKVETLQNTRDSRRSWARYIPTAVGQAIPHGEAWLLDDPAAVRTVLKLPTNQQIPNVTKVRSPKSELEDLLASSSRYRETPRSIWADIADAIDITRYQHSEKTGFSEFADDVRREIGPIASENSPATSPPPPS